MAFTNNAQSISESDKLKFEYFANNFIQEYDWVFYVSPAGVPIEDNKVRTTDEYYRNQIDYTIKHLTSEYLYKIKNFGIVSGSTEDRLRQLKSYLSL